MREYGFLVLLVLLIVMVRFILEIFEDDDSRRLPVVRPADHQGVMDATGSVPEA